MNSEKWKIVSAAAAALKEAGQVVWRTHLHKMLFLAKRWNIADVPFEFVLYQYGPYSFELDHEVATMTSFGVLERVWGASGYGSSWEPTSKADISESARFAGLAEWLGPKFVKDLEVLATVEYVGPDKPDAEVVEAVLKLKPHVAEQTIREAIVELRDKRIQLAAGR